MSSSKPPPKKAAGSGWGSLLSGAVANLESRLDTILAEDSGASARERAAAQAAKDAKAQQQQDLQRANSVTTSRDASRSRGNDRLAERLAKATAQKQPPSQVASGVPSRVGSPAVGSESVRMSMESGRSSIMEVERPVITSDPTMKDGEEGSEQASGQTAKSNGDSPGGTQSTEAPTLLNSGLPINPARLSVESSRPELARYSIESSRPSIDTSREPMSSRPSSDLPNAGLQTPQSTAELEATLAQMKDEHAQAEKARQEEMHAYMEKIDALQSKLKYLAKETVTAAKEANASASSGSNEAKLAEKDERIALLMEEGERMSKTELRHSQTIKKLRAKMADDDKGAIAAKKKLERAERAELDLKQKVRKAEMVERQANEKARQIDTIEKQVDELKADRESAAERIRNLTIQLSESKAKADRAEQEVNSKAATADKNKIATLENDLEDAQIEKKLAEDRAVAESKKVREEVERNKERFGVTELELKNEVRGLEARLEAMRSRAEEASSEGTGDGGSVALMRQVETLQSQYSLAKENWQTIESSLNARVSTLERERDEAGKREADVRKKARDMGVRSRKVDEELEAEVERVKSLSQEVKNQQEETERLQDKLTQTEAAFAEARSDFEGQRRLWSIELTQKLEEERSKWHKHALAAPAGQFQPSPRSNGSPALSNRKTSAADLPTLQATRRSTNRMQSPDLSALHIDAFARPVSRRSSAFPTSASMRPSHPYEDMTSPSLSRRESTFSPFDTPSATGMPPTPSIEVDRHSLSGSNSPQRTLNDLVSTSTAGAGPSVQLVERLSLAVRRLESEKATFKDELARLSTQRDEARNEVVELMREVDTKRTNDATNERTANDLIDTKRRYEASLQMLGEKEEEAQELKQDVAELKNLYRELVEKKIGPGS